MKNDIQLYILEDLICYNTCVVYDANYRTLMILKILLKYRSMNRFIFTYFPILIRFIVNLNNTG